MPPRRTLDEVKQEFSDRGYALLENDYKNNKQLLRFSCPRHPGKVQRIRFNDLTTGHGCKDCGRERIFENLRAMAVQQRIPYEEVKKEFRKRGYILIDSRYSNARKPLNFICDKHPDKNLTIRLNDLKDGGGCRYCTFDGMKVGLDEARRRFSEHGYLLLEDEYINSTTLMRYKCPKHPDTETRISLSDITQGHGCKLCAIEASRGKLSVHYNHELPESQRAKDRRYDPDIHAWRKEVYARDNFTCIACGDNQGGNLNAHHKDGFNWCIKRRYDVSNGATLCESCHANFHQAYGYGDNTEQQFEEWLKLRGESE